LLSSASSGPQVTRADLSGEAIRLSRLLLELLPEPECMGLLAQGTALVEKARTSRRFCPYTSQAAIAAVHGEAAAAEATDRAQIVALYGLPLQMKSSPVIRLNRAVAVAMRDGSAAGLALIQDLNKEGELAGYQWLYSAQADLHWRLGQAPEAQAAYRKALGMRQQEPERRYLERRLQELGKKYWMYVAFGGRQTTKGAGPK
jgi:RNA polymerase sigma-70 factor, ECF subfamily